MKYNRALKIRAIVVLSLFLTCFFVIPAQAEEIISEDIPTINIGSSDFDFSKKGIQEQTIETDEGTLTIIVEDIPEIIPYYSEQWPIGSFNKRVTANFTGTQGASWFATMKATFKGSVNPYIAIIKDVSNGDFNSTFITPTGKQRYNVIKERATEADYAAEARYCEKYSIKGKGQHDMCLYLQVKPGGRVNIFMRGIW